MLPSAGRPVIAEKVAMISLTFGSARWFCAVPGRDVSFLGNSSASLPEAAGCELAPDVDPLPVVSVLRLEAESCGGSRLRSGALRR